jgi:bile acid-coenzyme A ligase
MNDEPQSLGARARDLARARPDDIAVRHVAIDGSERSCTWAELDRRSDHLAGALAARGLGLGDRLGLGLRNSVEFVLSTLAAWKLGATPIPIRWDLPDWEFSRLRDVVDAKVFLGADDMEWIDSTAARPVPELPDAIGPSDVGICSSGSTGLPKVIVSQRPGVYLDVLGIPMMQVWRAVERPQQILVLAPMYHANGFSTQYTLLGGDALVIMEKFDAERVVDVIERHRVSTFTATPTMLQRIADLPGVDGRDLSSIDWILQGAAPMPPSLAHRWIDLIGAERMIMAYGMTESIGITVLRGDEWLAHEGSVGRGFRGTEIRILDDEQHNVPTGEIGEIYLRNPVYGGSEYLGPAPAMRGTDDGFFTVGDLGYLDADGYVYLVDRRVDVIITGGANVFPSEVEAALIDHPGIADVVVIGLADPEWGRRVHMIVAPSLHSAPPSADEVIAYAKSRLAAYKVPKTVEFVDEIPRSAATKVNRGALIAARGG